MSAGSGIFPRNCFCEVLFPFLFFFSFFPRIFFPGIPCLGIRWLRFFEALMFASWAILWYWFRSESDGKLLGIIRGEKKLDSSILEVGIMDYLEAFGIVFGISIFIFCAYRSFGFFFISAKVCILNKVSRYGCEKECGYMNFFLM